MATTLLIVGYLLAVPPLVFIRRMWRRRSWLLYLLELVGALCITAGWLLQLSLPTAAVNAAWVVGFGFCFPLFAGRGKRWFVVLGTGLGVIVVVGALGYGVIRSRFKKTRVNKASMGQAMSDYRRSVGGALKESQGRTPPSGVYQYAATGYYTVTVKGLGTDKRVMPKKVPAVLTAKGDCWELTVRYFKQHHWGIRYCNDPKRGLLFKWQRNRNSFFGLENDSRSVCDPDRLLRPGDKPPVRWSMKCRPKDPNPFFGKGKAQGTVRFVGIETVTVGGKKLRARHVHRHIEITGMQSAKVDQHLWYSDSNMMLKFKVVSKGVGMASFFSDYAITLMSLTPKR